MGMWAEGEMALLCQIAKPDIGVVTMVGPVHMERLGSIEAIAQEKGVLPASLPPDGVAVLNADDSRVAAMADRTEANVITYGLSPDADVRADEIESHGLAGVSFTLVHAGAREHVYSHLPGRAMVHNALAAAAVGLVDGLTIADVAAALTAAPARVRFHSRRGPNGSLIIDDAYNASPASVLAALDLLGEMPGRKIAVLGDMRELGAAETQGHRDVGVRAAAIADTVITVAALGRIIADTAREAGHADVHALEGKAEVAPFLRDRLREGDVVLLKASRALAFETIVEELGEEE
jgi:UDP-N-acetylmuramoyl-tripeptide--D-alanyl-D-alanine ligase